MTSPFWGMRKGKTENVLTTLQETFLHPFRGLLSIQVFHVMCVRIYTGG